MKSGRIRLLVACPTYGPLEAVANASQIALYAELGHDSRIDLAFFNPDRTQMTVARNNIVDAALGGTPDGAEYDFIFWHDADMVFPRETFHRLWEHCGENVDFMGALAFKRRPPYPPCIWHAEPVPGTPGEYKEVCWFDYPERALVEVTGTGFACILTRVWPFRKVPKPWFVERLGGGGSDLHCCRLAASVGAHVMVHTGIEAQHLGEPELVDSYRRKEWLLEHPEDRYKFECDVDETAKERLERRAKRAQPIDIFTS